MSQGILGKGIAILIAMAVLLNLAFSFIAEFVTWIACGSRPSADHFFSGLWLALSGDSATYAAPAGCEIPRAHIIVADYFVLALIAALAVAGVIAYRRYKESDRAFVGIPSPTRMWVKTYRAAPWPAPTVPEGMASPTSAAVARVTFSRLVARVAAVLSASPSSSV